MRYSRVPLSHDPIYHDNTQSTAMTAVEHKSDFELTKDTPYLTLAGELWGVYWENLE